MKEDQKYPRTDDPMEWALRFYHDEGGIDERTAGALQKWFEAAIKRGYDEGRKDYSARCTLPLNQYRAWRRMNAAPPASEAAPSRPEEPIESFDARVWAKEFMRLNAGHQDEAAFVDEDTMVTWFSNALMRGYDERRRKETGWQQFVRDTYSKFSSENPYPPPPGPRGAEPPGTKEPEGFSYEEAPAAQGDLGAEGAFLEKRLSDLEARQKAEDRAGLVAQLPWLYDKVGKLSLESRSIDGGSWKDDIESLWEHVRDLERAAK